MKRFFPYSDQAARFVEGLLDHSKPGCPLTTTITPEKSGGFSVVTVTYELLDDIDLQTAKFYSETQVNT